MQLAICVRCYEAAVDCTLIVVESYGWPAEVVTSWTLARPSCTQSRLKVVQREESRV